MALKMPLDLNSEEAINEELSKGVLELVQLFKRAEDTKKSADWSKYLVVRSRLDFLKKKKSELFDQKVQEQLNIINNPASAGQQPAYTTASATNEPTPTIESGPLLYGQTSATLPAHTPSVAANFAGELWAETRTLQGHVYFYNVRTRETTWTRPTNVIILNQQQLAAASSGMASDLGCSTNSPAMTGAAQAAILQAQMLSCNLQQVPPQHGAGLFPATAVPCQPAPAVDAPSEPPADVPNKEAKNTRLGPMCETCDTDFFDTRLLWRIHCQQHVRCGREGCKFEAVEVVRALHVQCVHETGYASKIAKLNSPAEIWNWRNERKMRFPRLRSKGSSGEARSGSSRKIPSPQAEDDFFCDSCEEGFVLMKDWLLHYGQHVKCVLCRFKGGVDAIKFHVQAHHETGYDEKIWKLDSAAEVKKWKEERKMRFPRLRSNASTFVTSVSSQKSTIPTTKDKFFCDTCDASFRERVGFDQHCSLHTKCFCQGCNFKGLDVALQLHVEMMHDTGYDKRILKLTSPSAINKWRYDRKIRFPRVVRHSFTTSVNSEDTKPQIKCEYYCDACEEGFLERERFLKHRGQHVTCGRLGCSFKGRDTALKLHVEMQHDTGYVYQIIGLDWDGELQNWREKRRQLFPTLRRIAESKIPVQDESRISKNGDNAEGHYHDALKKAESRYENDASHEKILSDGKERSSRPRSRSPSRLGSLRRSRSPRRHSRSPHHRGRSPLRRRSRSPIHRSRSPRRHSPVRHSRSPLRQRRSPLRRSRSPLRRGHSLHQPSPCRSPSPHYETLPEKLNKYLEEERQKREDMVQRALRTMASDDWTKFKEQSRRVEILEKNAQAMLNSEKKEDMLEDFLLQVGRLEQFFCDACDVGFTEKKQLSGHRSKHETCRRNGCEFEGTSRAVAEHTKMQHDTGCWHQLMRLSWPDEMIKWKERRRKYYPTLQRIAKYQAKLAAAKELAERKEKDEKYSNSKIRSDDQSPQFVSSDDDCKPMMTSEENSNEGFKLGSGIDEELKIEIRKKEKEVLQQAINAMPVDECIEFQQRCKKLELLAQKVVLMVPDSEPGDELFNCDVCDIQFTEKEQLDDHCSLHQKCPVFGCKFKGLADAILQHKEMQHDTGYAQQFMRLDWTEELQKWKANRKQFYPRLTGTSLTQSITNDALLGGKGSKNVADPKTLVVSAESNNKVADKHNKGNSSGDKVVLDSKDGHKRKASHVPDHKEHRNKRRSCSPSHTNANEKKQTPPMADVMSSLVALRSLKEASAAGDEQIQTLREKMFTDFVRDKFGESFASKLTMAFKSPDALSTPKSESELKGKTTSVQLQHQENYSSSSANFPQAVGARKDVGALHKLLKVADGKPNADVLQQTTPNSDTFSRGGVLLRESIIPSFENLPAPPKISKEDHLLKRVLNALNKHQSVQIPQIPSVSELSPREDVVTRPSVDSPTLHNVSKQGNLINRVLNILDKRQTMPIKQDVPDMPSDKHPADDAEVLQSHRQQRFPSLSDDVSMKNSNSTKEALLNRIWNIMDSKQKVKAEKNIASYHSTLSPQSGDLQTSDNRSKQETLMNKLLNVLDSKQKIKLEQQQSPQGDLLAPGAELLRYKQQEETVPDNRRNQGRLLNKLLTMIDDKQREQLVVQLASNREKISQASRSAKGQQYPAGSTIINDVPVESRLVKRSNILDNLLKSEDSKQSLPKAHPLALHDDRGLKSLQREGELDRLDRFAEDRRDGETVAIRQKQQPVQDFPACLKGLSPNRAGMLQYEERLPQLSDSVPVANSRGGPALQQFQEREKPTPHDDNSQSGSRPQQDIALDTLDSKQKEEIARQLASIIAVTGRSEISEDLLARMVQQAAKSKTKAPDPSEARRSLAANRATARQEKPVDWLHRNPSLDEQDSDGRRLQPSPQQSSRVSATTTSYVEDITQRKGQGWESTQSPVDSNASIPKQKFAQDADDCFEDWLNEQLLDPNESANVSHHSHSLNDPVKLGRNLPTVPVQNYLRPNTLASPHPQTPTQFSNYASQFSSGRDTVEIPGLKDSSTEHSFLQHISRQRDF